MKSQLSRIFASFFFFARTATFALAQATNGSIRGIVADPQAQLALTKFGEAQKLGGLTRNAARAH